ncbi:MAG: Thiol:disulfide interchange protein DsbE [Actinobacteria bacterium ADurb.BinA094]|nr:MAG: Thiol:disulfide interchange protein DsbE [Actinobacteria bacterium ADurb.BinA094]
MGSRVLGTVAAAAMLVMVLAAAGCGSTGADGQKDAAGGSYAGRIIPPAEFAVADFAGKPLVVNMFGSWCPPCNMEAPELAAFAEQNPDVQVVGVACQDDEAAAVGFMEEYGLSFPLVVDDGRIVQETGTTAFPTTIFFDAGGVEVDRIVGAATLDQFTASLAKAQ